MLYRYFYWIRIVEAVQLEDAWQISNDCLRRRMRRRAAAGLGNLEPVVDAIQEILEVWEFGPPGEEIQALDEALEEFLAGRRYRRGLRRTQNPEFRARYGWWRG